MASLRSVQQILPPEPPIRLACRIGPIGCGSQLRGYHRRFGQGVHFFIGLFEQHGPPQFAVLVRVRSVVDNFSLQTFLFQLSGRQLPLQSQ